MTKLIAAGAVGVVAVFGAVALPAQAARTPQGPNDCRTYSGVEVCGKLTLDAKQKQCVERAVHKGMSERRAEVECTR